MDALRSAQNSLAIQSTLGSLASTNVARAGDEHHARREAATTTDIAGARLLRVRRAENDALATARLGATTLDAAATARADAVAALRALHGGPDAEASPGALLSRLRSSLQAFAAEPDSAPGAVAAIDRAREFAAGLNAIGEGAARIRTEADASIARDVASLRDLLDRFGEENAAVVRAGRTGADGADAADARAATLASIAELVSVRTIEREHGDLVIISATPAQGVLFDTVARPVSFAASGTLGGTGGGAPVMLDGIAMDASIGGRIGGSLDARNRLAVDVAARADALAAMAIDTFSDRDAAGTATAPGLFIDPAGAPGTAGLASRLALNPDFDPEQGGDAFALRDGAPGGPAAARNPGGAPGFAGILIERIEAVDAPRALDPTLGMGSAASLAAASSAHRGALEGTRASVEANEEGARAALARARSAHSNATGVNIDEEMARLIAIEQSYRASARVLAVAEAMLDELFLATR